MNGKVLQFYERFLLSIFDKFYLENRSYLPICKKVVLRYQGIFFCDKSRKEKKQTTYISIEMRFHTILSAVDTVKVSAITTKLVTIS